MEAVTKEAGGRSKLQELSRRALERGISEKSRRRRAARELVTRSRPGEFRLCRLCHRLIYLAPYRLRQGALGFHNSCYRQYQQTDDYKDWRRKLGSLKSPMLKLRMRRHPHPLPPGRAGKPPTPEQLTVRFRWVLKRFLLHKSLRKIASEEAWALGTIAEGIGTFIAVLPDTWNEVFGGGNRGQRLDDLLPIARLRGSKRID